MRTTKQARKYKIKTDETPKDSKPTKEAKKSTGKFKVLIDGANFLNQSFETYEAADLAGKAFCKNSIASYMVVGGCN